MRRLGLAAALLAAACSSKQGPADGGGDAGNLCSIAACSGIDTSSCPSPTNYVCLSSCCVFFCREVSDCANEPCAQSALGCVCDLGDCEQKVCSTDVDCGSGKVCKGGVCGAPDTTAASCSILPSLFVARAGMGTSLSVAAFDSDGGVVRTGLEPQFTVSDGVGTVDSTGTFTDSQGSTTPGDVVISAMVGGATCTSRATVYAPSNGPRVTVIDANTALPITDATIVVSSAGDGTILGAPVDGGDALGRYAFSGSDLALGGMISVFEQNYEYASAVAPGFADGGSFGSQPDLVFVLSQTGPFDTATGSPWTGGYVGDFRKGVGPFSANALATEVMAGDVIFGIAGTAIPEDPASITLNSLLGPQIIANLSAGMSLPLPIGSEVDFTGSLLTCDYEGVGIAGGCGLAVLTGDAGAFTCGRRPAWGVGGPIPFSDVEPLLSLSAGSPDIGTILESAAPAFPAFSSAVGYNLSYSLAPPLPANDVANSCSPNMNDTGSTALPDPSKLTPYTLQLDTPVTLVADLSLPALPMLDAGCTQNAIILGGVIAPQIGLLPLGVSAAGITNPGGQPDSNCVIYDPQNPNQADGQLELHMAPAHGGVEGLPYAIMAVAGLGSPQGAVSGVIQTFATLPYGTPVTFSSGPFLGFVSNAVYTPQDRSFSLGGGLGGAAPTLYRLRLAQSTGGQWAVQIPPGTGSITLPVPPSPFADRTAGAVVSVDALQLNPGATSTALVNFANGPVAMNLMQQIQAFSSVAIQ